MLDIDLEIVVILLWLVIFFNYELLKSYTERYKEDMERLERLN